MRVNPAIRRRLTAIQVIAELDRLEVLLNAIGDRAIMFYAGEPIEAAYPHIADLLERLIRGAADAGAFLYFGVRDGADLLSLPDMLYPAGVPGVIGLDVRVTARLIAHGGSRSTWARPRDLVLTGAGR